MASGTASEIVLRSAEWVTASTAALVLLLTGIIVFLRIRRGFRERRRRRFHATWNPILLAALDGPVASLPPVGPADLETLLLLWNRTAEVLAGDVRDRLRELLHASGVVPRVRAMARRGGLRRRLMAVQTIGNLRDAAATGDLLALVDGDNSYLSISAARALVQIDPEGAVPHLVRLVASRDDWPFSRVAELLEDAGPGNFTGPLAAAALGAPPAALPRMLRLMEGGRREGALPAARKILDREQGPEVVAAGIRLLGRFRDPADLDRVRAGLEHPDWFVRMAAVTALGGMGQGEDEDRILARLSDPEWWVRYRAAQALVALPMKSGRDLARIRDGLRDRFAREILDQVLSEAVPA